MPLFAVIDVGTNSVKFNISERRDHGTWETIVDRAEITRLGAGLETTGDISNEAMERTVVAIAAMVAEARQKGVAAIAAVGTMGMRTAGNSQEFIDAVEKRCGVRIEVIPGEEEGRLAYIAVKSGLGLGEGTLVIFDTGGGSSQFTFGRGSTVEERFSVNVGAVRYTEKYGLAGVVTPQQLRAALGTIAADLSRLDNRQSPDALVGMGGAVTNITAVKHQLVKYDPNVVQGSALERAEVERQIELYRTTPLDARRAIVGLQPKRADVILGGACIVKTVMDKLNRQTMSVSDHGLRHGLLIDRFGSGQPAMARQT
jgi:exopolyphosphatase/guanosine-5'-triphosphate,3'-diphosphate pyrophosphatase